MSVRDHIRAERKAGAEQYRQVVARLRELRAVHPVPQCLLEPGAIVVARYPYREDSTQWKIRPCVIEAFDGNTVTVRPFTTSAAEVARGEVVGLVVPDEVNRLVEPSWLRTDVNEIATTDVLARRGTLDLGQNEVNRYAA